MGWQWLILQLIDTAATFAACWWMACYLRTDLHDHGRICSWVSLKMLVSRVLPDQLNHHSPYLKWSFGILWEVYHIFTPFPEFMGFPWPDHSDAWSHFFSRRCLMAPFWRPTCPKMAKITDKNLRCAEQSKHGFKSENIEWFKCWPGETLQRGSILYHIVSCIDEAQSTYLEDEHWVEHWGTKFLNIIATLPMKPAQPAVPLCYLATSRRGRTRRGSPNPWCHKEAAPQLGHSRAKNDRNGVQHLENRHLKIHVHRIHSSTKCHVVSSKSDKIW